jgi:hypothetical protein
LGKKPRFVQKKNSQKFTVIKTFFLKRYFNWQNSKISNILFLWIFYFFDFGKW